MATWAPSLANATATARPMPESPPVTSARFPSSRPRPLYSRISSCGSGAISLVTPGYCCSCLRWGVSLTRSSPVSSWGNGRGVPRSAAPKSGRRRWLRGAERPLRLADVAATVAGGRRVEGGANLGVGGGREVVVELPDGEEPLRHQRADDLDTLGPQRGDALPRGDRHGDDDPPRPARPESRDGGSHRRPGRQAVIDHHHGPPGEGQRRAIAPGGPPAAV